MRHRRNIFFNDARHYYLFVYEPPIRLEDVRKPIDEVAGTNVDTFIYGVQSGGLFYPSKVGEWYSSQQDPMQHSAEWRVYNNIKSLVDRGYDALTLLIDRAHERGLDFFASMRLGGYMGMDDAHILDKDGRGWAHPEVRDHQFAVLQELATEYATDGIELDLAAPPGGTSYYFKKEDVQEYTPVMTDWVRETSAMVRGRSGEPGQIGARVYPTEAINLAAGLDVRAMLSEGLLDYVVPLVYGSDLDMNMPIDWLIELAHANDAAVYAMIHPYFYRDSWQHVQVMATAEMMRAATAAYLDRGADGMYTWHMVWPPGDKERQILSEWGDSDAASEGNKHYTVCRRSEFDEAVGYNRPLPLEITTDELGKLYPIPFYIADDLEANADRLRRVTLKILIARLVSAHKLTLLLNGESIARENLRRDYGDKVGPYLGQWLEFDLQDVRPRKGDNVLEISLDDRPETLAGPITIEDVEVVIEYGAYPPRV